jgi:hypothetical protein
LGAGQKQQGSGLGFLFVFAGFELMQWLIQVCLGLICELEQRR